MLRDYNNIPPQVKLLVVGTLFSQLSVGLVLTDLAYYLTSVRMFPATFAGLVFTVEGLTSVLLSLPLGILSDRYGRKDFVVGGNIVLGFSIILISLSSDEYTILVAGALSGISEAAFTASTGALLAHYSNQDNRAAVFSISALVSNLAWAAGGFMLYLLDPLENAGLNPLTAHIFMYLSLAIVTLLSTLLLIRLDDDKRIINRVSSAIISRRTRNLLLKYVSAEIFVAFGAGLVVPLMSQWFFYKYSVTDSLSGPVLGLSSLLIAASTSAAPYLAKRFGTVRSIVLTEGMSTIFMFATPIPSQFALSAAIYTVRAFLMNLSNPLSTSMLMGMVPDEERGAASGITATFWRMPNAISTYPGSALMKSGYLDLPFYLASLLYLISIALFWFWFKDADSYKAGE